MGVYQTPSCLRQRGVEGLQERLVEVGNGLALVEAVEERDLVHAVQRRRRPVKHLDQAQRLQAAGIGKLLEERPQHRSAQVPDGFVPVEGTCGWGHPARPEHPGREDAVEERLHQRGAEEGRAALTLEADAERLLQRRTHRRQRRRVPRRLDPRQTVARV